MNAEYFARWRRCFFAGLAIVLPAVISLWVIIWLFFRVSNITNLLLIFLPRSWTHQDGGAGDLFWYWRLVAFVLAMVLITVIGVLARNYVGQKLIDWTDNSLARVPLFNKIYGATKQVNEAFTSGNKTSFKTVVMVEFPGPGLRSVGFLTSEVHAEIQNKMKEKVVCVFIPTTPNPTSGFLVLVAEDKVTRLDMSVTDGLKFIVSLGSINPENTANHLLKPEPQRAWGYSN